MARPRSSTLTEGEQRIMEVLWRLTEASVQDVTNELAKAEPAGACPVPPLRTESSSPLVK